MTRQTKEMRNKQDERKGKEKEREKVAYPLIPQQGEPKEAALPAGPARLLPLRRPRQPPRTNSPLPPPEASFWC